MSHQVFVSYSGADRPIALRIIDQLGQLGVSTWYDRVVDPGANLAVEIARGLEQSDAVLFLISPSSLSSESTKRELQFAIDQNKEIFPILIDEVDASSIPEGLRSYHWLDFRQNEEGLGQEIAGKLGQTTGAPKVEVAPRNKGYVFLSYAKDDSDFVGSLKEFLKERGYAYWDYEETDRDYHSQLFLELEDAISGSTALFAVVSEEWKRSRWTVREYFFAEDVNIPIFLLRAKEIGPTLAIAGMPYIDFTSDPTQGLDKLARELQRKGL